MVAAGCSPSPLRSNSALTSGGVSKHARAPKAQRALCAAFEDKLAGSPAFYSVGRRVPAPPNAARGSPRAPLPSPEPPRRRLSGGTAHPAIHRLRSQDVQDHPQLRSDRGYHLTPIKDDGQLYTCTSVGQPRPPSELDGLVGELESACRLLSHMKSKQEQDVFDMLQAAPCLPSPRHAAQFQEQRQQLPRLSPASAARFNSCGGRRPAMLMEN